MSIRVILFYLYPENPRIAGGSGYKKQRAREITTFPEPVDFIMVPKGRVEVIGTELKPNVRNH